MGCKRESHGTAASDPLPSQAIKNPLKRERMTRGEGQLT